MASIKITDLPAAPSALLTDVFPVDQLPGPITYKESNQQLLTLFEANIVVTPGNFTGILPVSNGGIGVATTTAYGLLAGGTTNTAPFQNIGVAGTYGDLLMFDTTTTLPLWKTIVNPYVVGPNSQYTTIQAAINAAFPIATDTTPIVILINPGTYNEDLTLYSDVNLSGLGGASTNAVIVVGNAIYNPAAPNGLFSANGIYFQTPALGGPALSTQGVNGAQIYLNYCQFQGDFGTAYENLNDSCQVTMRDCELRSGPGQKCANVTGGFVSLYGSGMNSTDTASTVSGSGGLVLNTSSISDTFLATGTSIFGMQNCVGSPPGTSPMVDVAAGANAVITYSTIVCNQASGYWITGTGNLLFCIASFLFSSAENIDPGITIVPQTTEIGTLRLISQQTALDMNSHLINNVTNPVSPQDAATKAYVDAAVSGIMPWTVEVADFPIVKTNGYFADSVATITATLPAVAAVGDTFSLSTINTGDMVIAQNAGQIINYGNLTTTVGVTGNLTSTSIGDSVTIVCSIANTGFQVINSVGEFNIN